MSNAYGVAIIHKIYILYIMHALKTIVAFLLLFSTLLSGSAQGVALSWVGPSIGYAFVGDTVEVALKFDELGDKSSHAASGFIFNIAYDITAFQFVGGTFGTNSLNPFDLPETDRSPFRGEIISNGMEIDAIAFSGNSQAVLDNFQPESFIGLTLNFKVISENPLASIKIDAFGLGAGVFGSDGNRLSVSMFSHILELPTYASNRIAEPTMGGLVIVGMMGFGWQRRRFFACSIP